MTTTFLTEPITADDVSAGLSSGEAALDAYFAKHALANDRRGIGKTFVLRRPEGGGDLPPILGFYTLAMADVEPALLPARGLPKYPAPVALIGRLAVDGRAQGRGFGRDLLVDALARVLAVETTIGCFGVIVDAKSSRAAGFYEKFGFVKLSDEPFPIRMFLAMKTIRSAGAAV